MLARHRSSIPILLLCTLVLTAPAKAQELLGRLTSSGDEAPIAGALVLLMDSTGHEIGRTLSSETGRFGLQAPAPGTYTLRLLRIGFSSWSSPSLSLARGERREIHWSIEGKAVRLPDIEVTTTKSRCGARPGDSDVLASLLNEAEKALAVTEQTIHQHLLRFRTETYTSRPDPDGTPGEAVRTTSVTAASWPVVSAPAESLAVWSFVHLPAVNELLPDLTPDRGVAYFGPDARVLFSDWFLDTHCFSVAARSADTTGLIVVEFVPSRRLAKGDIEGRLRIDPTTLELKSIEYRYTGLPHWVPRAVAGGEMYFHRLASGAWLISRWAMRAPIPRIIGGRDTTFFGLAVTGGRVTEIVSGPRGEVSEPLHQP